MHSKSGVPSLVRDLLYVDHEVYVETA